MISDLDEARQVIERLSGEVDALNRAAAARDEPAVPRSPPAKGGLPKVRPDESDDSDESLRAESVKGDDRSGAGSDGDDNEDGSGSDSAKSTTARKRRPTVDELAKDDPDLARQLQLVDKANAFKYMIAHGRVEADEVSSDGSGDADDPVGARGPIATGNSRAKHRTISSACVGRGLPRGLNVLRWQHAITRTRTSGDRVVCLDRRAWR